MEDGRRETQSGRTRDELELSHRRESLEMSRRNVAGDLERARNATHRSALQHALSFIDDELKKLNR